MFLKLANEIEIITAYLTVCDYHQLVFADKRLSQVIPKLHQISYWHSSNLIKASDPSEYMVLQPDQITIETIELLIESKHFAQLMRLLKWKKLSPQMKGLIVEKSMNSDENFNSQLIFRLLNSYDWMNLIDEGWKYTLWIRASNSGSSDIIKLLIENDWGSPTCFFNYPLRILSQMGYLAPLKLVMNSGTITEQEKIMEALKLSIKHNHYLVFKELLQHLDPSADGNKALKLAVKYERLEFITTLLQDSRVDPSIQNNKILHLACRLGLVEDARLLLQDSRVNPADNNNSSILEACKNGNAEIVKLLILHNVDPSCQDNLPLRLAVINNHEGVVGVLLDDYRVDPSTHSNQPLINACKQGNLEIVKLLMDKGCDPSINFNNGLLYASKYGHAQIVNELLRNPKVHPSDYKNLCLLTASQNGHSSVVQVLLNDGRVYPSRKSISYAKKNGHFAVSALLEQERTLRLCSSVS
ncbi:hypothetical protein HDV06_006901 [Boothiomyces sp. JEL0866]|nr:hypothetical protein HDV06_006901 [Boothiomyces sp. JEL0866]